MEARVFPSLVSVVASLPVAIHSLATFLNTHPPANCEHDVNKSKASLLTPYLSPCLVPEMLPGMQLIGTTPPKQINNGPVLQQCVQEMWNRLNPLTLNERESAQLADLKSCN